MTATRGATPTPPPPHRIRNPNFVPDPGDFLFRPPLLRTGPPRPDPQIISYFGCLCFAVFLQSSGYLYFHRFSFDFRFAVLIDRGFFLFGMVVYNFLILELRWLRVCIYSLKKEQLRNRGSHFLTSYFLTGGGMHKQRLVGNILSLWFQKRATWRNDYCLWVYLIFIIPKPRYLNQ